MARADDVVIDGFTLADDAALQEIERMSPQGSGWRLSFRRESFARRAANFADHLVLVARLDGIVVGAVAAATKDVTLLGEPARAAFYFDLRVHPGYRDRQVGRRLTAAIMAWGDARADFGYSYFMAGNAAMRAVSALFGVEHVGRYRYLVFPTCRRARPRVAVAPATLHEVHEAHLAASPPYDLYTDPGVGGRTDGWVASWLASDGMRRGGASVWDNAPIMTEVLEGAPRSLLLAAKVLRTWPCSALPLPRLPRPGEGIRSWYVFDVFGTDPGMAVDVVRQVAAQARDHGIEWLYLPHVAGDAWPSAVRREVPSLFAPLVAYDLQARWPRGPFPAIGRPYVDIRDI